MASINTPRTEEATNAVPYVLMSAVFCLMQLLAFVKIAYALNYRMLYPDMLKPTLALYAVVWIFFALFFIIANRKHLFVPRPGMAVGIILAGLLNTALFFGKGLLYTPDGLWISLNHLPLFFLLMLPVVFTTWLGVIFLQHCHPLFFLVKRAKFIPIHLVLMALLQGVLLAFYFYAYQPGNMSYDTYNQWSQIQGLIPYTTWHPIAHTLSMQFLLTIWNDLTVIAVAQLIFYVLVTTLFAGTLMKNNVRPMVLYLVLGLFAFLPNVGINLMTLWKDIPFTVGLLWATLILYKMLTQTDYFVRVSHIFEFSFCMLIISLYRYNGILAFLFTFCYAFIYLLGKNKTIKRNGWIALGTTLCVIFAIMGPVPSLLAADPNPPGMKLRPIFQGLGAMYKADQEDQLAPETKALMERFATPEEWETHYDAYFSDVYIWHIPQIIQKYSTVSTGTALKAYVETGLARPDVVIGDRFNLSILSWSAVSDPFSYDNRFTTHIEDQIVEEFGVMRPERPLATRITEWAKKTYESSLWDTVLWRVGLYEALLAIAAVFTAARFKKALILYIPLVSNWLIVFLTMPAQDYRYVWFVFMLFPFLFLALLSFTRKAVVTDEIN